MASVCTAIIFSSYSISAQVAGGESNIIFQWESSGAGDQFGFSVAGAGDVNADGFNDAIIGSQFADNAGISNTGLAIVYSGQDGSLLHQWSGVAQGDGLGHSVAGAGDVNGDGYDDLIVGASNASTGSLSQVGSAYVYSGSDGALLYQWNGVNAHDHFGFSVSGAGDVNADGFHDLIVGAFLADSGGMSSNGSARVYSGASGSLLYEWNGEDPSELFGISVSDAGDVNADGFDDLIVGAPFQSFAAYNHPGSAQVLSGLDGSILYQWNGGANRDRFGYSVSGAGDVNGDGFADLIVGAIGTDHGTGPQSGSAYVYSGADGSRLHSWLGEASNDHFSSSVSSAGDVNKDGFADLIVGAFEANSSGLYRAGSTYLYSGHSGSLLHKWNGESTNDSLGHSVASAGDVNGDGSDDLLVGAPYARVGLQDEVGKVYIYGFNSFLFSSTPTVSASAGGMLQLDLDFPSAANFDKYKILISASGVGPMHYGVPIPLTQDTLVNRTFFGNYPIPTYTNLRGTLDANGDASASLTIPAGIPSALIGNVYHLAAIANEAGQLPEFSSIAVSLTITP